MLIRNAWMFLRFLAAWVYTMGCSVVSMLIIPLVGPSNMWLIMHRPWGRGTLWLLGVRLRFEGLENLKGPAVFVCNHQSLIDIALLPGILPAATRIIAKREILMVPLFGWAFAMGGAVLVDRRNPRAAIANIRRGLKRLPKGWGLIVFPEGTRSHDGVLKPFKKGAFHMAVETKLPMVPIGLDGAHDIIPLEGWFARSGEIRICIGAPIDTSTWSNETLTDHIAEGRAAVQACMDRAVAARPKAQTAPPEGRVVPFWTPERRPARPAARASHTPRT